MLKKLRIFVGKNNLKTTHFNLLYLKGLTKNVQSQLQREDRMGTNCKRSLQAIADLSFLATAVQFPCNCRTIS